MSKAQTNACLAVLVIMIVGVGAYFIMTNTSTNAQSKSNAYWQSLNNEAFGTSTAATTSSLAK